MATIRINQ